MKKTKLLISALLLVLLVFVACAPQTAPAPAPGVPAAPSAKPAPQIPAPVVPAKPAWETQWEKTIEAAKAEGVLTFATSAGKDAQSTLSAGFKARFGIRVESSTATVGILTSRILAERRAGLYLWDVLVGGTGAQTTTFKPAGGNSPLEPSFLLPDLTDPEVIKNVWFNGKLPWVDKEHHLLSLILRPGASVAINTELVKPGEIKTWDDLLNPKWKGKLLMLDPTSSGDKSDAEILPMLYESKGEAWVRKLAAQEPVILSDDRLAHDWLSHGKYPIYISPRDTMLTSFIRAGAPITGLVTEDVTDLSSGPAALSIINKPPHPNAARVFANWMPSKEGETILSQAIGSQSARLDVPIEGLPAYAMRQPGVNYWLKDREESLLKIPDYRNLSKDIFGPLMKK